MAHPLRCLDEMLAAVRAGTFQPDATRSGRFTKMNKGESENVESRDEDGFATLPDLDDSPVLTDAYQVSQEFSARSKKPNGNTKEVEQPSSSSETSSVSNDSSSDSSILDGKLDADAQIVLAKRRHPVPSNIDNKVPYYHPTSAVLHYRLYDSVRLKCGRTLSNVFVRTTWAKSAGLINCSVCFK